VVQQTLDSCTAANVRQMKQALETTYRQHSHGIAMTMLESIRFLNVDMSGMPCGKKAAFESLRCFAKQRNRRGRQLGRVLATCYEEVVADRLFDGTTQLAKARLSLLETAEQTLELDEHKRERTLVRVDAGGGSVNDVNWLLARGYQVHCKDYSSSRAQRLAASVQYWVDDPSVPGRQVG
jgi:hypothetical protein